MADPNTNDLYRLFETGDPSADWRALPDGRYAVTAGFIEDIIVVPTRELAEQIAKAIHAAHDAGARDARLEADF